MKSLALLGCVVLALLGFAWSSPAAPVGAPVHGRVTFEDGTPAAGARVKWLSLDVVDGALPFKNRENEMVCGADGAFRFEKMKKGPFRLEATALPANAKSEMFAVVPKVAEGTPNLKIVLKCGSSISGRVVDTKGSAVPAFRIGALQRYKLLGAKDRSTPTAVSGPEPREFKDDDGKFTFECLPDGEWEIFIAAGGTLPPKTVTVTLPRTGEPIELVVPPLSEKQVLTGRVVDPDGKRVAKAEVRAFSKPEEKSQIDEKSGTSDKDGAFRVEKLRSWPYVVFATAPGFSRSEYLELEGTESAVEITLTLRASCKLSGDVVDASGQPVADAYVTANEENTDMTPYAPQTKTDSKGHFELVDLVPGPNVVYAYTDEEHGAGEMGSAKRVVLAADAPATVKLKLRPPKK
jgi:uncharacterized GH25 family protein